MLADILPQVLSAWQALTGEPLHYWSASSPGSVPPGLAEAAQGALPGGRFAYGEEAWWVASLERTSLGGLLLSRDLVATGLSEPAELLRLLTWLLQALDEEQSASRSLTEELISAWNRLNLLFAMARIAAEGGELHFVFPRLAQALLQVFSAEDLCLVLEVGGKVQVFTASGRLMPSLSDVSLYAPPGAPLLVLRRGRGMPSRLAASLPRVKNLVLLPLPLDDRSHGVICLLNHASGEISASDRQLLLSAAEQIGVVISATLTRSVQEASRRLDHELAIASQIQTNFLPTRLPVIPGLEFAANLKPAYLIGGDFYDVLPVEGGLAIMVADVAGKGIPAAMLTALIHATLKSEAQYHCQPADLLRSVNRLIYDELDRSATFITAFLAILQTNPLRLSYASAGHTTTLLWQSQSQDVLQMPSTGLPLGIGPHLQVSQCEIPLATGDVLLLYSDGITEAENEQGRVFGTQALIDLLVAMHPACAERQLQIILDALDLHRGKLNLRDDVVLFLARAAQPCPDEGHVTPFVYMAEKRAVRSLSIYTRQVAQDLQFPNQAARTNFLNELELAVSEIATNVVVHAYRNYPYTGRIQGRITTWPGKVVIDLVDNGLPYQPDEDRSQTFSLADPPVGGYGLLIARRLLDVCEYSQLPGGRNHWRLEKSVPRSKGYRYANSR